MSEHSLQHCSCDMCCCARNAAADIGVLVTGMSYVQSTHGGKWHTKCRLISRNVKQANFDMIMTDACAFMIIAKNSDDICIVLSMAAELYQVQARYLVEYDKT